MEIPSGAPVAPPPGLGMLCSRTYLRKKTSEDGHYEQALVSLEQNSTAKVEGGRTKAVKIEGG